MTPLGNCHFCGRPVEPGPAAYPVSGWEVTRARGGANRVVGRKRQPGKVAHVYCAERAATLERQGLAGQGALL
jgi:ribosomal protein L24E